MVVNYSDIQLILYVLIILRHIDTKNPNYISYKPIEPMGTRGPLPFGDEPSFQWGRNEVVLMYPYI